MWNMYISLDVPWNNYICIPCTTPLVWNMGADHMTFVSFVGCVLIQVYVGPEEGTKTAVCEEGHWDGCITRV